MFCEKCGTPIPDGTNVCPHCGAAAPQPAQPAVSPVRAFLRTEGTGPLFLTGAIAYTAALVCQLIAAFLPGEGLGGVVYTLTNSLPSEVWDYAEQFGVTVNELPAEAQAATYSSTLFPTLFAMLPGILTAVALWLIFVAVRDRTEKPISTAGFTILKVLTILGLVGQVALLIAAEIGVGLFGYFMGEYSSDTSPWPLCIPIMVLIAIGFGLAILYNVFLVRTLNSMAGTARTLVPCGKVSAYVAVVCFIGAAFQLSGLLFAGGIFDQLNLLGLVVSRVAFAILLLDYRSKVAALAGGQ